ncbi:DUF2357 domain-containing protein [Brevibacillus borstelensis]|uniref:DUF2357 domain-containing protein n=1 Tax=Brevibacillus TaxID=55080 RepID=UPI003CE57A3F
MIALYYKPRWDPDQKWSSADQRDEPFDFPTDYVFQLVWEDIIPETLRVDNGVVEQFQLEDGQKHGQYAFILSHVKASSKVVVEYRDEAGNREKAPFFLQFNDRYFPSDSFKFDQLLPLFRHWKQLAKQVSAQQETGMNLNRLKAKDWREELEEELSDHPIFTERSAIIALLENISRQPKRKLIDSERLVTIAELDRVTSRTMQFFMREPGTWDYVPLQKPRPNRVMKEEIEESIDLYENRFVLTFIQLAIQEIHKRKEWLKKKRATVHSRLTSLSTRIAYDILAGIARTDQEDLQVYDEIFQEEIKRLQDYHRALRYFQDFFQQLHPIAGFVRPNQVLIYDKDYSKLYAIYQQMMALEKRQTESKKDEVDFLSYYTDNLFFMYLNSLQSFGFQNVAGETLIPFGENIDDYPFTKKRISIQYELRCKKTVLSAEVTRTPCDPADPDAYRIACVFRNEQTKSKTMVVILPSLIAWRGVLKKETVRSLYEKWEPGPDDECTLASHMIAHATWSHEFAQDLDYETGHYLINLGANFLEPEDWKKFGYFRMGMIPQLPGDEFSERLFMRLVHIHLFLLGLRHRCFVCGSDGERIKVGNADEAYRCSNRECNMEWGISTCSSCQKPMLKMQKKVNKDIPSIEDETELSLQSDMNWILEREQQNAGLTLSNMCENHYRGNSFFAICPSCGQCQHETRKHKYCRRCDAKKGLCGKQVTKPARGENVL